MKAVIVGSDTGALEFATLALQIRWPDVTPAVAPNPAAGVALIEELSPEVVLLHPDDTCMRLSEAIQEVRQVTTAPLLVLGSHDNGLEAVTALTMGADDYVKLPCDETEVTLRVWAKIRRSSLVNSESAAPLRRGPLLLNVASQEAYLGDQNLNLSPTEFRLLRKLVENDGAVVTHRALSFAMLGRNAAPDDGSQVRKYIQRLRSKLGDNVQSPKWISCVHGVGYRFVGPPPDHYPGAQACPQLVRAPTPEVACVA
jgi:two-component system, OmpR family, KDP operon response regulator KdpE